MKASAIREADIRDAAGSARMRGAMPETIHGSVLAAAARYPERTALLYKCDGRRVAMSYRELAAAVESTAERIRSLGLRAGEVAGLLAPNGPEWVIADLAILALGGIVAAVCPGVASRQLRSMTADSCMRILFIGRTTGGGAATLPKPYHGCGPQQVVLLEDVVSGGATDRNRSRGVRGDTVGAPVVFDRAVSGGDFDGTILSADTATIVYTSGTTGEPRGVILTHRNIVSNTRAVIERFALTCEDSTVSYLPAAHMFERTCGEYAFLFAGGAISYAEGPDTMLQEVAAVRPTVMIAVPRVLERLCAPVRSALDPGQLLGGGLRLLVCGGAALDPRVGGTLRALGLPLVEGYGLTEASPVVTSGTLDDYKSGTAGKPLRGVEVKISRQGEILVRGPNVMRGILNDPEATRAAMSADGWLRTGDLGGFDSCGNLVVTARSKEIIVTSCGQNIAPGPVERALTASGYIEQAMILGDDRKCIVALIVPRRPEVERYARERGMAWSAYEMLLESAIVHERIACEVARANLDLAPHERVAGFILVPEAFSEENGMLTPALKLRRRKIAESCAAQIAALYRRLEAGHAH
jgi:long-chain acyl-CoA synthetase